MVIAKKVAIRMCWFTLYNSVRHIHAFARVENTLKQYRNL